MTTAFTRVRKLPPKPKEREIVDAVNALIDQTVQSGGPLNLGVKTLTNADTPYTVIASDQLLKVDTSSGVVTINLPAKADSDSRQLTVKKITLDDNAVTIDGNSTDTIDGAATQVIHGQYEGLTIRCDASTGWDILSWI